MATMILPNIWENKKCSKHFQTTNQYWKDQILVFLQSTNIHDEDEEEEEENEDEDDDDDDDGGGGGACAAAGHGGEFQANSQRAT